MELVALEPATANQCLISKPAILASAFWRHPRRVIIHWRYALVETRNYEGAHSDPLTGWFDWADEYWTVYPDGVAVRKQLLWSSAISTSHFEWQEAIVINGPGQRPEDNIQPYALTLENMAGQTASYKWEPKTDQTSFTDPKAPQEIKLPADANTQIVQLKSKENPFQIVSPVGVLISPYTYVGQSSRSAFQWWNHWPVAQIDSSGRPAIAPDRASSTSLSHIYWAPYAKTAVTETKLLLCGLTSQGPANLLPLARSWLTPPRATLEEGDGRDIEYDPTQRAYVIHPAKDTRRNQIVIAVSATRESPLVDPAFVIENWSGSANIEVTIDGVKPDFVVSTGIEHYLDGDSLILYLPFKVMQPVQLRFASRT